MRHITITLMTHPTPQQFRLAKQGKSVVVMRTFSKIYGMAGLRMGYAVGRGDLIAGCLHTRSSLRTR